MNSAKETPFWFKYLNRMLRIDRERAKMLMKRMALGRLSLWACGGGVGASYYYSSNYSSGFFVVFIINE